MPDVHAAACKRLVPVHTAFFFLFFSPAPDSAGLGGRWLTLPLVTEQLGAHQPPQVGKGLADGGQCLVIRDGQVISWHLKRKLKPCWYHLPKHFTQVVLKRDPGALGISVSWK